MRALAQFVLRGPLQAGLLTVGLAIVSSLIVALVPVGPFISASPASLVTLQVGAQQGLWVLLGGLLGFSVLLGLLAGGALFEALAIGTAYAAVFWLPVWIVSWIVRTTRSLSLGIQGAGALGVIAVVAAFAALGDPGQRWLELLEAYRPQLEKVGAITSEAELEILRSVAPVVAGGVAAVVVLGTVIALLVGRGAQALVYHPGGLAQEFRGLRFDRATAIVTLAVFAAAFALQTGVVVNVALVLVPVYVFAGLAVMHGIIARTRVGTNWLMVMYVVLAASVLLLAQTGLPMVLVMGLVILGLADAWVDFRSRAGSTGS